VGQIFEFVEVILFLKAFLGGGLTPSSQTVGSLLIPLVGKNSFNGFEKLKILPMDITKSTGCDSLLKDSLRGKNACNSNNALASLAMQHK
jgi:hypothetical protein